MCFRAFTVFSKQNIHLVWTRKQVFLSWSSANSIYFLYFWCAASQVDRTTILKILWKYRKLGFMIFKKIKNHNFQKSSNFLSELMFFRDLWKLWFFLNWNTTPKFTTAGIYIASWAKKWIFPESWDSRGSNGEKTSFKFAMKINFVVQKRFHVFKMNP